MEQKKTFRRKRKFCKLCPNPKKPNEKIVLDYKDINFIKQFISDKGKILPRRVTGTCAKHQRVVAQAVKRARHMGLIPFVK